MATKKLKLKIEIDGTDVVTWHDVIAALDDWLTKMSNEVPEYEVPNAQDGPPILDYEGNTVGSWKITGR